MTREIMQANGERLRKIRGIRTRAGVARETGISCSALQSYEEGWRNPSPGNKQKLAEYYGVSETEIFFDQRNYK